MNERPAISPELNREEIEARAQFCRGLLASAGSIAMEGFRQMEAGAPIEIKGPQDFITEYDARVETHIREHLAEAFPGDGFLGEETGAQFAPRLWVVDPIDGTANFARAIPHFAVSIAFVENNRILFGGLHNPALDETYFAQVGKGACRNGRPIRAAATKQLDHASVELGWSSRIDNTVYLDRLARLLDLGTNVRRASSGALAIAYVADGRSDAYAELHINAWDCLAGLLLAREAGAIANDYLAGEGLYTGNPILVAAPGIADAVSRATSIPLASALR